MIRAVLFDMDGVLLDTERLGVKIMPQIAAKYGYIATDELYYKVLGVTNEEGRQTFLRELGPNYPYDQGMNDFLQAFAERNRREGMPRKQGAAECLAALRARGLRTALATSTARWLVNEYMEKAPDLDAFLQVKICGGDAARSKPNPDIYLLAAQRVGCAPEECVGVEDSLNGVRALRAAGMTSVMVPDLLPYGDGFAPYVDHCLPSLAALPALIDRLNGVTP